MNIKKRSSSFIFALDVTLAIIFFAGVIYLYEGRMPFRGSIPNPYTNNAVHVLPEALTTPQPLNLLYAVTQDEQNLGLGQRASLPADKGMLFIFSTPGNYGFWMKDMSFSIDMIWMDQNFRITHIEQNVSPDTYPQSFYPNANSSYVLETNAGYSQKNNLLVGETLDFIKNSLQNKQ